MNAETVGNLNLKDLILSDDVILAVTMENAAAGGKATVNNVKLEDNASLSIDITKMDAALDAIVLPDQTYLALTGTDGDVSFVSADVKDGNANGLCIRITGSDLSGGRDGNVSFDDFVKANGRVVLDLAGSFAGTDDDSYLELGKDTCTLGTSFTLGGDLGSEENWLIVDNSVEGSEDIVTLRIEKVDDVYVRGMADGRPGNNYDTLPLAAAGPMSLITGLTEDDIVGGIADAIKTYIDVIGSSDASDAEKAAAAGQLSDVTAVLAGMMTQDVRGSETLKSKLAELLAGIDQDMLSDELKEIVLAGLNDPASVTEEQMKAVLSQLLTDEGRRELLAAHAAEAFTTETDPGETAGVPTSEEVSTETGTEGSGDGLIAEATSEISTETVSGYSDDLYEAEEPESSTEISVGYGEAEPGRTEEEAA